MAAFKGGAQITTTDKIEKHAMNHFKENFDMYWGVISVIGDMFEKPTEDVYLLTFDNDSVCDRRIQISKGSGSADHVEIDFELLEKTMDVLNTMGRPKWGISHNHPAIMLPDGKQGRSGISAADIVTTASITKAVETSYPSMEYMGHFVAANVPNGNAVIHIEGTEFRGERRAIMYDQDMIDKEQEGRS